jgi:hypothetical protein
MISRSFPRPLAKPFFILLAALALWMLAGAAAWAAPRWTAERANDWYRQTGWLIGANYNPHTAMNQLEMWQAETFDLTTIERELTWAESLGFNSLRVYLHHLPWEQDAEGFTRRIDQFLGEADRHGIGVMFVLFDSVWDPHPRPGPQRQPTPHLHNSGWVQSPGAEILRDPSRHDSLKGYVQGVIRRFGRDRRVQVWDLWNEPDNMNGNSYFAFEPPNKAELAHALLHKTFAWAREVNPEQPLTAGIWIGDWPTHEAMTAIDQFMVEESDVITFHNYGPPDDMRRRVEWLRRYGRPLLCTEYMARPNRSTFEGVLPYLKEQNVSAYNWGFVAGRSQTIYPWDSWQRKYTEEPPLWFHDIFRPDGSVYREEEVALIRRLTGKSAPAAHHSLPRRPITARRPVGRATARTAAR